jgi:nucleotide-binding universal stress UspA family protein
MDDEGEEGSKMYKKMMVPLDGSELAECVLPHAEAFIKGFGVSDVLLVRVEPPETIYLGEYPIPIDPTILAERESGRKTAAKDYLDQIVKRLKHESTTTLHAEVLVGRVAESLIDYAEQNGVDLILMATHGRSGVTRWVRGSIADRMLRSSNIPVLMVRAPGTKGGI